MQDVRTVTEGSQSEEGPSIGVCTVLRPWRTVLSYTGGRMSDVVGRINVLNSPAVGW